MAITVPYEEISSPDNSPLETKTRTTFDATRTFKVAWSDRLTFAEGMLGNLVQFDPPEVYPHFVGAYAQEVSMQPWPGAKCTSASGATDTTYDFAKVVVLYGMGAMFQVSNADNEPETGVDGGSKLRYTERFEDRAEFITFPHQELFWDSAGTATPITDIEAPGVIIPMMDWVLSYEGLDKVPASFDDYLGKLNNATHTSFNRKTVFAAETLLCMPISIEMMVTATGQVKWRMTKRFSYRRETWNKFPKRGETTMQKIYKAGGGGQYKPYATADFTKLVP